MTSNPFIIRQGDILIVPIAETPAVAVAAPAEDGRLILARGEATGHHHSIRFHDKVALFREDGTGEGLLYLSVFGTTPVALEHQEHHALAIPPGAYEVRRQREYHPETLRRVED